MWDTRRFRWYPKDGTSASSLDSLDAIPDGSTSPTELLQRIRQQRGAGHPGDMTYRIVKYYIVMLYADRIRIFKKYCVSNIVYLYIYIYMILYNISRSQLLLAEVRLVKVFGGGLEFPTAWNLKLSYPPRLASSQAVWPWLDPTRGHCQHVATGSKFGSIRILSIIAYSCQIPCQANFHPHVYIYIYIYVCSRFWVPPSPPPMVMAPLSPVAWEVWGYGTPSPCGVGGWACGERWIWSRRNKR